VISELDPESGEVRVLLKRASDGTSDALLSEPGGLTWQGGYPWYVSWSEGLNRIVRVRVGP
jgi:predicted NUDIX family NTP pyrophosphohydrolase